MGMLHTGKLKRRRELRRRVDVVEEQPKEPVVSLADMGRIRAIKERRRLPATPVALDELIRQQNKLDGREFDGRLELCRTLQPGIWKGQPVYIIGGGKSAADFPVDRLRGALVITINRGFELVPWSALNVAMDVTLFGRLELSHFGPESARTWMEYGGYRVWWNDGHYLFPVRDNDHPYDVHYIRPAGVTEFPTDTLSRVSAANNSGYLAVNLAAQLGAGPIYLIGYDMKGSWWHDGYGPKHRANSGASYYDGFLKYFDELARRNLVDARVVNRRRSRLTCWPNATPSSALASIPRRPLLISYYTDERYRTVSERLRKSAQLFGLDYHIEHVQDRGSWRANSYYKAEFILSQLERQERDVLWVDADAVIQEYPALFDNATADLMAHWRKDTERRHLLSGTLYVKNSEFMRSFVRRWIGENALRMETEPMEQRNLERLVERTDRLIFQDLPPAYCQIFDTMGHCGTPVIEHFQASRGQDKRRV